jgi:hypothetical protein
MSKPRRLKTIALLLAPFMAIQMLGVALPAWFLGLAGHDLWVFISAKGLSERQRLAIILVPIVAYYSVLFFFFWGTLVVAFAEEMRVSRD